MNTRTNDTVWIWHAIVTKKTATGLVVCLVLAYLVTMPLLMKPLFESEAIVYVPLSNLDQQVNQQGIGFGNEHEVDWYIQMLTSNVMTDSLLNRFCLNKESRKESGDLTKELASEISIEKTRYGSVSVKVRDHNPQRAAAMANMIVLLGEKIKNILLFPNRKEAMEYSKALFEQKLVEVTLLEKTLDSVGNRNIGLPVKNNFRFDRIIATYKLEIQELILRKNQYERIKKDFETSLPAVYVISPAIDNNKPVYPKRLLTLLLAGFSYIILLIIIEIVKRDFGKKTE